MELRSPRHGYSSLLSTEDKNDAAWRQQETGENLELSVLHNDARNVLNNNDEALLDDLKVCHFVFVFFSSALHDLHLSSLNISQSMPIGSKHLRESLNIRAIWFVPFSFSINTLSLFHLN